jgi:hypothetical protein
MFRRRRFAVLQQDWPDRSQYRLPSITFMDCAHDAFQTFVAPPQKNVLLGFEVPEEGARRYFSLSRDLGDGDALESLLSIEAHSRIDQRLAGATLFGLSEPESGLTHHQSVSHCLGLRRIAALLVCTHASMH